MTSLLCSRVHAPPRSRRVRDFATLSSAHSSLALRRAVHASPPAAAPTQSRRPRPSIPSSALLRIRRAVSTPALQPRPRNAPSRAHSFPPPLLAGVNLLFFASLIMGARPHPHPHPQKRKKYINESSFSASESAGRVLGPVLPGMGESVFNISTQAHVRNSVSSGLHGRTLSLLGALTYPIPTPTPTPPRTHPQHPLTPTHPLPPAAPHQFRSGNPALGDDAGACGGERAREALRVGCAVPRSHGAKSEER